MNRTKPSQSKTLRVLFAALLALGLAAAPFMQALVSPTLSAYAAPAAPGEQATSPKPPADLTINTAEDFFAFAIAVNSGNPYAEKTVRLGADIDLAGAEWTPIGSQVPARPFAGTFDGDGHNITGLSITAGDRVALFGYVTGTLADFTVEGSVQGGTVVAGVVAQLGGGVKGVTNRVTVSATGSQVGGIAAEAAGTFHIADCINEGEVSNTSDSRSSGRLGGIIGQVETGNSGVVERCANTGEITGYQYLGGIAGGVFGDVSIRTSYNTAKIEGKSFGKVYLGGIVGKLQAGTIDSCYNRGEVYGNRTELSMGHIRAIGGIVGCEENHPEGTAIANVYQAGWIHANTANMDRTSDNNYIMMTGHISGGNNSTAANTMTYANAFYEQGCYPQTSPAHPDFPLFHQANGTAIWDTPSTTPVTTSELQGAAVLAALGSEFAADEYGKNDGLPVLAWQNGVTTTPSNHEVLQPVILGGMAAIVAQPQQAPEGTTVSLTATAVEPGKRVYHITATDVAGAPLALAPQPDGSYTFTMPARNVTVEVLLENDVAGTAAHTLTYPHDLDGIWTLEVESSGKVSGGSTGTGATYAAGSTVFVWAHKAPAAFSTILEGIAVEGAEGSVAVVALKEGLYAFTMPACDVAFTLDVSNAPLTVAVQRATAAEPQPLKSYSRAQMLALAQSNSYYSGWSSETDPLIGRADTAVALARLLADAGVSFAPGDTLRLGSIDGMYLSYTYEELLGTPRYYYPGLFEGSSAGRSAAEPLLTIQQNVVLGSEQAGSEPPAGDTLNAYRFVYGQSEADFTNHTKAVDRFMKYVTSVTIVKGTPSKGDLDGDGALSSADLMLAARALPGLVPLNAAQRTAADIDGDGAFSTADIVLLARMLVGLV